MSDPPDVGFPSYDLPHMVMGFFVSAILIYSLVIENDGFLFVSFSTMLAIVITKRIINLRKRSHFKYDVHLEPLKDDAA